MECAQTVVVSPEHGGNTSLLALSRDSDCGECYVDGVSDSKLVEDTSESSIAESVEEMVVAPEVVSMSSHSDRNSKMENEPRLVRAQSEKSTNGGTETTELAEHQDSLLDTKEDLVNHAKTSVETVAEKPVNDSAPKHVEYSDTSNGSDSADDPTILALPLDSLHTIASFLTPKEWCQVGKTNRTGRRVCNEIVRRVRLHSFRCATEVVTAWKLGQHADAKELAALYIRSGVPIYPRSLGHSYHTLLWKMNVETTGTGRGASGEPQNSADSATIGADAARDGEEADNSMIDSFYRERSDFRGREGYGHDATYGYGCDITYLAEKYLFFLDKALPASSTAGGGVRRIHNLSHRRAASRVSELRASLDAAELTSPTATSANSQGKCVREISSGMKFMIHQHLLNQHNLGREFVDDKDGTMVTPPVSLSADFFHPASCSSVSDLTDLGLVSANIDSGNLDTDSSASAVDHSTLQAAGLDEDGSSSPQNILEPGEREDPNDTIVAANGGHDQGQAPSFVPVTDPQLKAKVYSLLRSVELDVYSSSKMSLAGTSEQLRELGATHDVEHALQARFSVFQRRLEALLNRNDHSGVDECMLDFWDEFFPHTAGFQYFDQNTAVPRLSSMQKFLTTPCPKAVGTVQCEIERIKISPRGKGVNMKGRLFPSYEYRLFIRNRPQVSEDSLPDEDSPEVRRDTVLMVAKNRGRKHAEVTRIIPPSAPSKKGANNYFLCLPQQTDVDDHFNQVNSPELPTEGNSNGAVIDPVSRSGDGPVVLGRLQSNFIGTEFQIYTPQARKGSQLKTAVPSQHNVSQDAKDSKVSRNKPSMKKSRFGRLSLRRSSSNPAASADHSDDDSSMQKRLVKPVRLTRSNRRAIANTPDNQGIIGGEQPVRGEQEGEPEMYEEEGGAITYTANLLGSRPRCMDVCIPKVTDDGVAGRDWRRYAESRGDSDEKGMLQCFRRLLQQQDQHALTTENDDAVNNHSGEHGDDGNSEEGDNRTETEASSPEDFGLLALQNRPPWWNIELGSFVLNFGGRVSVASVKNFQLCERNDHDRIMLQFGRIQGRHSFTMDFQHPLTPVQAFSIAISSLQSKISFG